MIHTAIDVKNWFHTSKVRVLPWSAKKPNLIDHLKRMGHISSSCLHWKKTV